MVPKEPQPGVSLKKSPFLVVTQLDHNKIRIYSKLHGHLTSFDFDINKVLKLFDAPLDVETAIKSISVICQGDPSALVKELYEKRFLIEENKNEKNMLAKYVEMIRHKNRIAKFSKVIFLISAKCNLACKGCYHHFFDFKGTDMTGDFAGLILEGLFPYLKKRGIAESQISFLGYEPLLNFETLSRIYEQACSMGAEYGIKTSFKIFTNAFSINEKMYKWIEQNKFKLRMKVSIDGIKEDNDKRRVDFAGKGTHDRVVENIKRIMMTGVECGVLTVLSKLNFSNLEKFADEMAAIGIKTISANIFCGQSEEERLLELTELEKFEAIKRMDLATEKYGIEFDGEWKFAVVQMIAGAQFACPAGIRQLVFSADGAIYPCQRFAGTKINFGTYKNDFWEKLLDGHCGSYNRWTADLYQAIMERTKEENPDLTGWSCPFLPFLRGECIGKNLDRELNEYLLEYYLTRPLNRIITKSRLNDGYGSI
ncbi:MAG: radical SAM protein [Desulfobacteraceae bacterium]|nr:MAG: radical SAM protein [Desulfobacteraceae bacterium]